VAENHIDRRSQSRPVLSRRLEYVGPYDGQALLAFLARRAVVGVEHATDERSYQRSLRLPRGAGVLELRLGDGCAQAPSASGGRCVEARFEPGEGCVQARSEPGDGCVQARSEPGDGCVQARLKLDDGADLEIAERRCRELLDLDRDPRDVVVALGSDPVIGRLVRAAPGRRVPGVVDPNELAIRGVLGQQVSVAGARTLAGRLAAEFGEPLGESLRDGVVTHLFPSAAALAAADPERLPMPASRRRALLGLAGALASGAVVLDPAGDRAETRERLLALRGIGPWTADYIAMRALRDPDAFLPTDLGVRRALERLGLDGSPKSAARIAEAWRPYRAYALQHLWSVLAT
jgi:AraC family transcriptional regulator of adaptative response / DNA-3-methyladenine glycosylase II